MDGQPTHQIIDGYGIRWEVLCGRDDWQTAHCDITKTTEPVPRLPGPDGPGRHLEDLMPKAGGRGYGRAHMAERARWAPKVEAGQVACCRCHRLIVPNPRRHDRGWHLDHTADRTGYLGPSHALCNLSAGGRIGAAITNGRRPRRIPVGPRHSQRW
jgi:hypothetical protein